MIKKYYDKLSVYPRLRILIIFIIILVVLLGVMRMFSSHQVRRAVVPPSSIPTSPVTANRPHAVGAAEYNQLQEIQKRAVLQNAEASGSSYFENNLLQGGSPVTTPSPVEKPANTPALPKPVEPVSPENFYHQQKSPPSPPNPASPVPVVDPQVQEGLSPDQLAQAIQAEKTKMQSQLSQLSSGWGYPTFQTTGGGDVTNASSAGGGDGNVTTTSVAIKAGTIFFGVLEVTLNSDQANTPVMATIVSGSLKGAKLLGTFSRQNEKLVIQFNTMTIDSKPASIGINAYAIDPETAQNALASNVDNHYLLRYGSVFASAFLQGFGNAWSNVQTPASDAGGLINVYNAPPVQATTKTAIYQGLGQIGTNLSQQMAQVFNTPPTVTLNAGSGIGVLFMSDLSM
jgi:intracellular multiplication protein IcmE